MFESDITLDIIHDNISYPIIFNTSLINLDYNDIEYYNEFNISDEDEENENVKNKYDTIVKKNKKDFYVKKISFIVCDYYKNKDTFDMYITYRNNGIYDEINTINIILNNLNKIYEEQHFIHGDFKIDNILVIKDMETIQIKPYFYDLEFSILFKKNVLKIISRKNPRVNLYLELKSNFLIIKEFLHIFDYYLFTISILAYHIEYKKVDMFLLFLDNYIITNKQNHIMLFSYFYYKLNHYFTNSTYRLNISSMLKYNSYKKIYEIINYSYYNKMEIIENNMKSMYNTIDELNENL
jgi:hypothetical protein